MAQDQMKTKSLVLVVGASGMLGSKIVEALLAEDRFQVRALVRNLSDKRDKWASLEGRGVSLVEGDIKNKSSLDSAVEGVEAVISAVHNEEDLIVNGQSNLLSVAERHGVKRFIPSDFAVDYRKTDYGDNENLDMRKRFFEVLSQGSIPYTLVLQGAFTEMLLAPGFSPYDSEAQVLSYWGDGEQLMDFTTTDDTARYVAATVLDPRTANKALEVAGSEVNYHQIAASIAAVTGKKIRQQSLGAPEQLLKRIEEIKPRASNPWEYLALQYQWVMITGKGKLDQVQNQLYPEIEPVGVETFLRQAISKA